MMTSKYGNGFTNYFLTNDGFIKKATNKDYKYIDLDRFLKMIESDKINQIDLIYNDEGTPIINGLVNQFRHFTISFNEDQIKELKDKKIRNESLAKLMDKTIAMKDYEHLKELDEHVLYYPIHNISRNLNELAKYKEYVKGAWKANRAIHLSYVAPYAILSAELVAYYLAVYFLSKYNIQDNINKLILLGPIICYLPPTTHIFFKKDEFESSMTALQRYSMYLELIDEIREDTIKKNKDVYDARKNFYNEVSNIRSKIDVLPDDIKEFYNINVQEIINNFERHLKDISNKKYYSNLYNNELDYESLKFYTTDSIQTLVELSESISSIYNNEGNSFTKTLTSDTIIGEKSI